MLHVITRMMIAPWTSEPISQNDDQSFHTGEFAVPSLTGRALIFVRGSYPFVKSRFVKLASFAEPKRSETADKLVLDSRRKCVSWTIQSCTIRRNFYINNQKRDICMRIRKYRHGSATRICNCHIPHGVVKGRLFARATPVHIYTRHNSLNTEKSPPPPPFLESLLARNWTAFEGRQGNLEFSAVSRTQPERYFQAK